MDNKNDHYLLLFVIMGLIQLFITTELSANFAEIPDIQVELPFSLKILKYDFWPVSLCPSLGEFQAMI